MQPMFWSRFPTISDTLLLPCGRIRCFRGRNLLLARHRGRDILTEMSPMGIDCLRVRPQICCLHVRDASKTDGIFQRIARKISARDWVDSL